MILKSLLLLYLPYLISGKYVKNKLLRWPEEYSLEATKLYLSSGWIENLKYWRSTEQCRMDANDGAVTRIRPRFQKGYGQETYIHPVTTEEETNKKVCLYINGTEEDPIKSLSILPAEEEFKPAGDDNVKGVGCIKFLGDDGETLWAYFDDSSKHWVPVRYEKQWKDTRHGYISDHEIYDFFNFKAEVDDEVFHVFENYECETGDEDDAQIISSSELLESMKPEEKEELDQEFAAYKRRFNKKYAHNFEHEMRKRIFHKSWRLVRDTNQQNFGYKLGLNEMSDRSNKEMKRYKGLRRDKNNPRETGNIRFPYTEDEIKKISTILPLEYDSRLEGLVGPILHQEYCGSCWSFGTTAAVEGALAKSNGGMLIALSNQALLDCSWGYGNGGCDGGSDIPSYKWIMKHGLPTQAEYGPYLNQDGFCNIENMTTTYKIRGWVDVTPYSEEALKIALINHGPLSVSINAGDAFTEYEGGILYDPNCDPTKLDHEVTLVGYGQKDGESFWILKNSWGPEWGIDGYIHISTRDNTCGVMTEPTYVVV